MHKAAAAAGAVDLNLLLLDGSPAAFIYGYHYRGYVYGLRRGYDAQRTREGAGNVLLAHVLCDGFARGDRLYDMGVGSLASKRHFQTRLLPIVRYSHFPALALTCAGIAPQTLVARPAASGVHRGRPRSGCRSRLAMNLGLPGGMSRSC